MKEAIEEFKSKERQFEALGKVSKGTGDAVNAALCAELAEVCGLLREVVEEERNEEEKAPKSQGVDPFIWDFMEETAYEKYYIQGGHIKTLTHIAEDPAFLLVGGVFCKPYKHTLWLSHVAEIGVFKLKREVYAKLQEITDKSEVPIKILKKLTNGWKVIAETKRGG